MISTGMDGWCSGNLMQVFLWVLWQFIPLNVGAFEMSDNMLWEWCRSWMGLECHGPLITKGWFWEVRTPGVHVWPWPPSAALVTLKELVAGSTHKRPCVITHVFIFQRLMGVKSGKLILKGNFLHPGLFWPHAAFEIVLVGIYFKMTSSYPCLVRKQWEKVVEEGHVMSCLSKSFHLSVRDYFWKLWLSPRPLPALKRSMMCYFLWTKSIG